MPSSVVVLQYYWVKKEAENIAASSNIVAKYANVMHIVKRSTFFVCLFFGIRAIKSPLRHGLGHTTWPNFLENNKEKIVRFLTLSESEPGVFKLGHFGCLHILQL